MVGPMCKIPWDDQKCLLDASQKITSRVLVEEANEFKIVSITSDGAHVIDFQGDWHWYLLVIGGAGSVRVFMPSRRMGLAPKHSRSST
jgi:hypothetical protein